MTVVCAMKFDDKQGAIIADEQASNLFKGRQYKLSNKLAPFQTSNGLQQLVLGGSGATDALYDTQKQIRNILEDPKRSGEIATIDDLAHIAGNVTSKVMRKYIDAHFVGKYGITEAEFQTGQRVMLDGSRVPIDPSLMQDYQQTIRGNGNFFPTNSFLGLAFDAKGLELFNFSSTFSGAIPAAHPYDAIGSGADVAEIELYNFFERVPRHLQNHIDPRCGLAELFNAVDRASVLNMGVGGTPAIGIVKKSEEEIKVHMPPENNCRLAGEIVRGTRAGLLSEEFQREALDNLLLGNLAYQSVEKNMQEAAGENAKKLGLLLRGYKLYDFTSFQGVHLRIPADGDAKVVVDENQ